MNQTTADLEMPDESPSAGVGISLKLEAARKVRENLNFAPTHANFQ